MAMPPLIQRARTPLDLDADEHIIIQGGKRTRATNREVLAGAQTIKGDTGPAGPPGAPGAAGAQGAQG